MNNNWLVLSDRASPTERIYFLEPLARASAVRPSRVRLVRAYSYWGPKAFLCRYFRGAHVLVTRSLKSPWIDFLESMRQVVKAIYYLIDDDLSAAEVDCNLPEHYRKRVSRIAGAEQPRILRLADEVITTSHYLAERFARRHPRVSVLEPALVYPLPPLTHFEQPSLSIGYHGTRAHLHDLLHIAPALRQLHDAYGQIKFELMLGGFLPQWLSSLPRVATPRPKSWPAFCRYQRQCRIHIGLAPLLDTPFNRGKSHIKFLDIAAMGGVGVYSRRYPYTRIVEDGVDGLLVDDDCDAWYAALCQLIDDPDRCKAMALAAAKKAERIGNPDLAAAFWQART